MKLIVKREYPLEWSETEQRFVETTYQPRKDHRWGVFTKEGHHLTTVTTLVEGGFTSRADAVARRDALR